MWCGVVWCGGSGTCTAFTPVVPARDDVSGVLVRGLAQTSSRWGSLGGGFARAVGQEREQPALPNPKRAWGGSTSYHLIGSTWALRSRAFPRGLLKSCGSAFHLHVFHSHPPTSSNLLLSSAPCLFLKCLTTQCCFVIIIWPTKSFAITQNTCSWSATCCISTDVVY